MSEFHLGPLTPDTGQVIDVFVRDLACLLKHHTSLETGDEGNYSGSIWVICCLPRKP